MMISIFLVLLAVLVVLVFLDKNKSAPVVLIGLMILGTSLFVDGLDFIGGEDLATGEYLITNISTAITQGLGRVVFWGAYLWLIPLVFRNKDRSRDKPI